MTPIAATSTAPPIPQALKTAFAHHSDTVDTPAQLAAIAGLDVLTVETILADPASTAILVAHRQKLEAQGDLRPTRTARVLDKAVARIAAQLETGVDGFEAADLAKPLVRLVEHFDRVRLAERVQDANANLPVFNFIFTSTGFTAEQLPPTPVVIDIAAKDVTALPARGIA
jgi:hypothetical protein